MNIKLLLFFNIKVIYWIIVTAVYIKQTNWATELADEDNI